MNYLQGSQWRKWDLHIHSPASIHNNFEGSTIEEKWNKYAEKLQSLTDISVLGITDYFSIDGYKYVRDHISLPNVDLILPNVELRILPVTNIETPINIHVIFNPEIVDSLESKFFSSLTFYYKKETYRCIRSDLIKLGRKHLDNGSLDEGGAYKEGVQQFVISASDLQKVFFEDKELRDKSVIIVSNSNRDGNSGIQHSSLAATRQEIYTLAHCIFSPNSSDFSYFLGLGTDDKETIARKLGNLKPCIHGSDAHSLEEIGRPCTKRSEREHVCSTQVDNCDLKFCWIKADTTFEGFKQIIYEPEERVRIQEESPFEDRKKVYFDSVSLEGSINFVVPNTSLPLNRELITIIGGRGSGKSALLELIAFLNEEHTKSDQNDKPKLIEFYRNNVELKNPPPGFLFKTNLIDKDNNIQDYSKSLNQLDNLTLPFLYIGQEQLSSLATNDKALTIKVCELINLNFSELENTQIIDTARELIAEIGILRADILDIQVKYIEFDKRLGFEKWLNDFIAKKTVQKMTLSSKETKQLLENITKEIDRQMKLRDFADALLTFQGNLDNQNINERINELNSSQKTLYKENLKLIPKVLYIDQEKSVQLLHKQVMEEITSLGESIEQKKRQFSALGVKEDITALMQSIESVQRELNIDIRNLAFYREKLKLLHEKIKQRNMLYKKIVVQVQHSKKIIDDKFLEFSKSRDNSSSSEQNLFKSTIQDIDIEGAIEFKQETFCNYILDNCVDRRKIKTRTEIKERIAGKVNGIANEITLDLLAEWVEKDLNSFLKEENFNDGGELKLIEYLFTRWQDFVTVKAIAKLKQVPTEKLSVGQRGTLLLKIYLATSSVKQIFIVDQPEDNLDNHFIMHQLVPLIREIKKSRQIILSTHNANLVVNADAEQVIIANLDQNNEKEYLSGSIENPIINNSIKEILEGGVEAFISRERKYGFGQS